MLDLLENSLNAQTLTMLFAAVAAAATVLMIAMPLVFANPLERRMRSVAIEREKMRQRERERLAQEKQRVSLRQSPKQYVQTIVDRFNLSKWVGQEEARLKLVQAGYRGQAPYITYLFFRMVTPVAAFLLAALYLFVILHLEQPASLKLAICIGAAYLGMHLPLMFLKNRIQHRQISIRRAFPDTLDLLLICVESGMSIEAALSYLPERRQAYENLARRTDIDGVKSVCMALQQAERYGTPLASTLRTMAQENRDMRMAEAEKKAAALPPKLTVPMILFFLPVLFVVILGPAAIKVMHVMH
jgi:tight adherence protein C